MRPHRNGVLLDGRCLLLSNDAPDGGFKSGDFGAGDRCALVLGSFSICL